MRVAPVCWCGGALGDDLTSQYRRCRSCGSAVLTVRPGAEHFDVVDDERDYYGRAYWTEYAQARHLPTIAERARADLSERCVFWLERLLEVVRPPGRALEIGCGHGGFVRLLQELGFDAVGTELSPWVVEFARRTFDVRVLLGRLETLPLEPGFRCIAAFDVLEHLSDPLGTARRCRELLDPGGALLLQTPCYRGEGPDWSMFQPDEHIHLFTEDAVDGLLRRAGFATVTIQPSLFAHDMWIVARPTDAVADARAPGEPPLPAAFRALLDLRGQLTELRRTLDVVDADRAERLVDIDQLTRRIHDLDARLAASEGDRADRLAQIDDLTRGVRELTERLAASEADRAARLAQVEELTRRVHDVTAALATSEADRAARLDQIHALTERLATSEADRAARLDVIGALQADVAALRAQLASLGDELGAIRNSWIGRMSRRIRPKDRSV
ncbi:MAG TPA: methyltransferase domain-containing protein [Solirubrobacteraceae bacterium]